MRKNSKEQLKLKISELETKNKELGDKFELAKTEHSTEIEKINNEWEAKEETTQEIHDEEIEKLETQTAELTDTLKQKQSQLDSRELKRLASAYKEQEDIYKEESSMWLKWLMRIGAALTLSTIISIWLPSGKVWYDKFEYYLIDFVFLSAVWFCSSQYSSLVKLRNDYANRKTIAQSFHNILNNLAEDEEIKDKFIEKATDVLCAPSFLIDKEPILSKKLIKDTAEIVKSVRG